MCALPELGSAQRRLSSSRPAAATCDGAAGSSGRSSPRSSSGTACATAAIGSSEPSTCESAEKAEALSSASPPAGARHSATARL